MRKLYTWLLDNWRYIKAWYSYYTRPRKPLTYEEAKAAGERLLASANKTLDRAAAERLAAGFSTAPYSDGAALNSISHPRAPWYTRILNFFKRPRLSEDALYVFKKDGIKTFKFLNEEVDVKTRNGFVTNEVVDRRPYTKPWDPDELGHDITMGDTIDGIRRRWRQNFKGLANTPAGALVLLPSGTTFYQAPDRNLTPCKAWSSPDVNTKTREKLEHSWFLTDLPKVMAYTSYHQHVYENMGGVI